MEFYKLKTLFNKLKIEICKLSEISLWGNYTFDI